MQSWFDHVSSPPAIATTTTKRREKVQTTAKKRKQENKDDKQSGGGRGQHQQHRPCLLLQGPTVKLLLPSIPLLLSSSLPIYKRLRSRPESTTTPYHSRNAPIKEDPGTSFIFSIYYIYIYTKLFRARMLNRHTHYLF